MVSVGLHFLASLETGSKLFYSIPKIFWSDGLFLTQLDKRKPILQFTGVQVNIVKNVTELVIFDRLPIWTWLA